MSYRYIGTQWQRATLKGLFMAGVFESLEGSLLTYTHTHTLLDIKKFGACFTCLFFLFLENFTL